MMANLFPSWWLRLILTIAFTVALIAPSPLTTFAAQESEVDGASPWQAPIVDNDGDETTDGYRAEQVIVRLVPGVDEAAFNARYGTTILASIPSRNIHLLQLPSGADEVESEGVLGDDPDVVWAELNFASQAPEGRPRNFFVSGWADEASYTGQYASGLLGLDAARACSTGGGVLVAVVDTGIDATHPALSGLVGSGWNVFVSSADVSDIGNGVDDDGDGSVDEMTGHGTHVAGMIAQVAPGAVILPIKSLDSDGVGDAFFLAAAIYHAIDSGAAVINLSLGSTHSAWVVEEAVAEAVGAGIVVTAAAGNLNRAEPAEYPAAGGNALGVAATDANDLKSDFSNYHPILTISAPGTEIVSAVPGGYASWSGTSMATPFVSGAAALVLDAYSGGVGVRDQLAQTATPIDEVNPGYGGLLGAGRLDVAAAVGCGATSTVPDTSEADANTSEMTIESTGSAIVADTDGDGANCRAEASTDAAIIAVLPEGTVVDLAGEPVGEWQPVFCGDSIGYVHTQFLSYEAGVSGKRSGR
jgi:thermitase